MKTEHLLYIYANTQYGCAEGDKAEFDAALKTLTGKISYASPTGMFEGSNYLGAYIAGMYPELEKSVKFFQEEIYKYKETGISDILMKSKALMTISKFGLQRNYDFDKEPNDEQFRRINAFVRKMQKNDLVNYASPVFRDLGIVLMQSENNYQPIHQFIEKINIMNKIVSGTYPEEKVKESKDIAGVVEGLALLDLKKQGIINDKSEITDINRFCDAEIVKNFAINGKVYDLSKELKLLYEGKIKNTLNNGKQGFAQEAKG